MPPVATEGSIHGSGWTLAFALQAAPAIAAVAPTAPSVVVDREVGAYNRGDLVAFADCFSDDVELYQLGATAEGAYVVGRAALIDAYQAVFARNRPQAIVLSRTVTGGFVTDQRRIVIEGNAPIELATYEVREGRIRRVWFAY